MNTRDLFNPLLDRLYSQRQERPQPAYTQSHTLSQTLAAAALGGMRRFDEAALNGALGRTARAAGLRFDSVPPNLDGTLTDRDPPARGGWVNELTGQGGRKDKMSYSRFDSRGQIDRWTLEAMFDECGMARTIISRPVFDSLKNGWKLTAPVDPTWIQAMEKEAKRLDLVGVLEQARQWEAMYGGAAILIRMDGDDDQLDQPLTNYTWIRNLAVMHRWELYPRDYGLDPLARHPGQAETYLLTREPEAAGSIIAATKIIHKSRLLIFRGSAASNRARQRNQGWGTPELTRVFDELSNHYTGARAAALLMSEFTEKVFSMKGLYEAITEEDSGSILQRLELMAAGLGITSAALIDADNEKYERHSATVSGMAELRQEFRQDLSAVCQIPMIYLFGTQAAGLQNEGGSSERDYDKRIGRDQTLRMEPQLTTFYNIQTRCARWGETGEDSNPFRTSADVPRSITWEPLWTPTDEEKANVRYTQAQTDQIYLVNQVVTPETIARSRFGGEGYSLDTNLPEDQPEESPELEEIGSSVPPPGNTDIQAEEETSSDSGAGAARDLRYGLGITLPLAPGLQELKADAAPVALLIDGPGIVGKAMGINRKDIVGTFARQLYAWIRDFAPDRVVVAFDPTDPTTLERYKLDDSYKANRPGIPEDLEKVWPHFPTVIKAMGATHLEVEGHEADDVIATLTKRYLAEGYAVHIVSRDKDLQQLAINGVTIHPDKETALNASHVAERWGLAPEALADLLALTGDRVDGIPGAPGIGPDTAQKLLKEYGNLAGVLEKGDLTEEQKAGAARARKLVELRNDLDLPEHDPSRQKADVEALQKLNKILRSKEIARIIGLASKGLRSDELPGGILNFLAQYKGELKGPVLLLNAPIVPADAELVTLEVSPQTVKALCADLGYQSWIGHTGAAQLIEQETGLIIPVDRRAGKPQEPGQLAIALKMPRQLEPGREFTCQELRNRGCQMVLILRVR